MMYASAYEATTQGSRTATTCSSIKSGLMSAAQVGDYDLVLAMGTKLLEKWESRGFRRDILLSMALAQCGLATDTFAVQQVSNAYTSKYLSSLRQSDRTKCCCLQEDCIPHLLMLLCTNSWHILVHHQCQCMCYKQTVQSTAKYKYCTKSCARFSVMQAALSAQCISYTCTP